jgi:iron complex outermembrane receptor protein
MAGMFSGRFRQPIRHHRLIARRLVRLVAMVAFIPHSAYAQSTSSSQGGSGAPPQPPAGSFQLPPITVTAQKEPADPQTLPVSLTAVTGPTLANAGVTTVREASFYAPNVIFTDFTARKLSNARFRGIGSSPANPAVTTYLDGVPQLHANTSSLELIHVGQVEFVRGPQGALFGRNALGGLVNITSVRPPLDRWSGSVSAPFASRDGRDVRGSLTGPIVRNRLGLGVSLQYGRRDGFTTNEITGNDLDSREAFAGKAQLLWTPAADWETRVIVSGERARDGDYALTDLAALRATPFHTARDYEGFTHRDVFATTVMTRREGARVALSTTTGFVKWTTDDSTDLDYSPLPLAIRDNAEESFQFTQELRLASAAGAPVRLSDRAALQWQSGVFFFTQHYDQDALNTFAPFLASPLVPFPVSQRSPFSGLDDLGVGVYGQGTVTFADRYDASAGVRVDHEQKDASLSTSFVPPIFPARDVNADESFSNVSPQFAVAARIRPGATLYASVTRGFKAGGFNAASPAGRESYGEEHAWGVEGGIKTTWAAGRVVTNASVFRIDWDDLQLNVPDASAPGQFFISNVGSATSSGAELEVNARVHQGIDVFSALGYTHARFSDGSVSGGVSVAGNTIPNTPDYTATMGTQLSRDVRPGVSVYGRAEAVFHGAFHYDEANTVMQDRYSLTNLRGGVRGRLVFAEAWIRNAFDTHYIPVALPLPFAPSGFVGEPGTPRTFGVTVGVGL